MSLEQGLRSNASGSAAPEAESDPIFVSGTNVPEEGNRYVVFTCEDGHKTPVYVFPQTQTDIRQVGRCQFAVRNVAKSKIDIGFAHLDRPVAVWFAGREGACLPWMSMLKACDKCFVDYECVPEAKLNIDFVEKPALKEGGEVEL